MREKQTTNKRRRKRAVDRSFSKAFSNFKPPEDLTVSEWAERYRVLSREGARTCIEFYPITGRTHQLRLHSAHVDGLNAPIVGDEIYGTVGAKNSNREQRLHLHASYIAFVHPCSGEEIEINCPAEF